MTAITVLIIVGVVNILLLFMILSIYKDVSNVKLLLNQIHNGMGGFSQKLHAQEAFLNRLGSAFSDLTNALENITEKIQSSIDIHGIRNMMMYRTIDGKYSAQSLDELIRKIKNDGVEESYLSEDEMDNLRKLFEKENNNGFSTEEEEIDDDDDGDDDTFNPEQGKF